ncbi:MAG TPA: hypothetical protein VLX92_25115 [Kofleriaceae bacterium]|nr:hypothetical protein [Kofleriaceae bacterium]
MRWLPIVLALPLLVAASGREHPQREPRRFRLELAIDHAQGGTYISAWTPGDVISDHDGSSGLPVTYHRLFHWLDDCEWESIEVIVPESADRYLYTYREHAVSCPDGTSPDGDVTRTGIVTVHPASGDRPITPLVARVQLRTL